jgi:hypothetical protein
MQLNSLSNQLQEVREMEGTLGRNHQAVKSRINNIENQIEDLNSRLSNDKRAFNNRHRLFGSGDPTLNETIHKQITELENIKNILHDFKNNTVDHEKLYYYPHIPHQETFDELKIVEEKRNKWLETEGEPRGADIIARKNSQLQYRDEKTTKVLGLPAQIGDVKTYSIVSHTKSVGKVSVYFQDEEKLLEFEKLPRNKKNLFTSIPADEKMEWAKVTIKNLLAVKPKKAILRLNKLDIWLKRDKELVEALMIYIKHHNWKHPGHRIYVEEPKVVNINRGQIEYYEEELQRRARAGNVATLTPIRDKTKKTESPTPILPWRIKTLG